ncbi:MAG: hypothetical protein C0601_07455 [Candidatus Muiribacterium halophilum]|uniref:Uncharacterized protein n=1 Tax=Muiribacterium halophilum TaxID=2053465 RepID=A0A2N5ZG37_MUIH1|nr:MAG: hypothetical protein C0601_07455 [Candidatus Muirbacterium halophilum]
MVIEKNFRIVVTKSPEYKLLDYSKILNIKENSFISPLFFSLRDDSYYNDEYYYKSTIIFNRPVIYIDDKAYPTKYVSLKKHDKNRDYFNEILYMLDMDKVSVRLKKRNGRAYFLATLKISTPSGIYERKMPVFVKKEE